MLLYEKFEESLFGNGLMQDGEGVLVALSGGGDSVFLIEMMALAREKHGIIVEAFHLNHMLREGAPEDEAFVERLCLKLSIPLHSYKIDIAAVSKESKKSIEEAGRDARYKLLSEIREKRGLNWIATAHHYDDNIETALMRIIRGTAIRGLSGIPEKSGRLIRPLLSFPKAEIIECLKRSGIEYKDDPSNADTKYFRNRVRHEVIPMLLNENPQAKEAIAKLIRSASQAQELIHSEALKVGIYDGGGFYYALRSDLAALSDAVLPEALFLLASKSGAGRDISQPHIEHAARMIKGGSERWKLELPGLKLECRYGKVESRPYSIKPSKGYECRFEPGSIQIVASARIAVVSQLTENIKKSFGNDRMHLDYDKMIGKYLSFRSRAEGDVFCPLGLGHHKSIKKFFIDRKVPDWLRSRMPIFMCGDEIMLVGGLAIDERFKIGKDTKTILEIKVVYDKPAIS